MANIDLTKLNKFVGMLGSEHAGEQSNAARFIQKMAVERKMSMVEFFTAAYGGGSERIVYKEKIVYRDSPGPSGTAGPKPQSGAYGGDDFARAYANAQKRHDGERTRSSAEQDAYEMRQRRDAAEDARMAQEEMRRRTYGAGAGYKSRAYGHNGDMTSKIRDVLKNHIMAITLPEKKFLEDLVGKLDTGYEMTPKQRAWYADIMKKVGY